MKLKSRMKKLVSYLLLCVMTISGMATGGYCSSTVYAADVADAVELEGSGTKDDPYVIEDSKGMWLFAETVAKSSTRTECAKVADGVTQIDTTSRGDLTDQKWTPIGDDWTPYKGTFDGNGAVITICIESGANYYQNQYKGLFGKIGAGAEIRNVTTAGSVSGSEYVGGICGAISAYAGTAKIVNCNNEAKITGTGDNVGGIVGSNGKGSITADGSMYNKGEIQGRSKVGGIVGHVVSGNITVEGNLENTGKVTGTREDIGGLVGYLSGATLETGMDMRNTGEITQTQQNDNGDMGGLVGDATDSSSIISRQGALFNTGSVSGKCSIVGGLVGMLSSSLTADKCIQAAKAIQNTGAVSGQSYVGGICGYYTAGKPITVENGYVYNTGIVTGNGQFVGGVAGSMNVAADAGDYANIGFVTNTGDYTGGVIGCWSGKEFSLQNAYNSGEVTVTGAEAAYTGGIVGQFRGLNIQNAYHTTALAIIGNQESDKSNINGTIQNCFCLDTNTTTWEGETRMPAEAFASGEVAYMLDGVGDSRLSKLHWGQNIGVDELPVLGGKTVYPHGEEFRNTEGHAYGTPEYVWNDADLSCRAVRSCTAKGCTQTETETVTGVCVAEVKAGCETKGSKTYRATFENPGFAVQTKVVETAGTGHDIAGVSYSKDEKNHWKDCRHACGTKLELAAHTWKQVIDREATATTAGSSHEECSVCGYQKAAVTIPATGTESGNTTTEGQNTQTPAKKGTKLTTGQATVKVTNASTKDPQVSYEAPKSKKAKTITVPDTVEINGVTFKVTSIAKNAFAKQKQLKSVTIGKHITMIGERAFAGCKKLQTITIGKSVTKIGKNAFTGCKNLKKITILTTKLTKKSVAKDAFKGVSADVKIVVPKKKLKAYKSLFRQKGLSKKIKLIGA